MTPDQVLVLLSSLDKIIFLLQALCHFLGFLAGVALMQLILHSKNQRNLF